MKTKNLLIFICLIIPFKTFSQSPAIEWLINDSTLVDIAIDSSDNIIALKKKSISYEVIKYNNHGTQLWSHF